MLLSISCEDVVENDITLLLLGTYSHGINTSLMIIAGMEKGWNCNVYLLSSPINEQYLYLIYSVIENSVLSSRRVLVNIAIICYLVNIVIIVNCSDGDSV